MNGGNETTVRVQKIIDRLKCPPWSFRVIECPGTGTGALLYLVYWDEDTFTGERELQVTRKWYISGGDSESSIVQTALKACLTSAEHQVREHFQYDGVALFQPHFGVRDLVGLAREYKESRERASVRRR